MIEIEKFIPGGMSLGAMPDGKKAFFWNALPGEKVAEYEIIKQKSHFLEAIATKIESPSPYRVEPKDECFLSTSPWQILDFNYEQQTKQELVVEIFREHQIDIPTPQIITDGKQYFYRNKMEYALYWDNEENIIKPAFHIRGSHRKTPISSSSIERQEIFQKATEIIDELNLQKAEARNYQSLLLRCNQDGEVSGGLFENHQPHPKFKNLQDKILGYEYSYSPNGFFQINLPVYEKTLEEIKKHITTEKVLDLYSGVGTIGLSVARDKDLTLVEVNKSAYEESLKNILDLKNVKSILDKSENVTDYIEPEMTVILDPPRAGCEKSLVEKLLEINPTKIIYLSCNPATQARDIKILLQKYHIEDIKTFNFFPHTPHIENLVVLSK